MSATATRPDPGFGADRAGTPVTSDRAVEVTDLRARWGRSEAIRGLDFSAPAGLVTAILGPNGAGKSTLFTILTTLKKPASGTVRVLGHDVVTEPQTVRAQLGVVFQEPTLDRDLTVQRNLEMHASLYGVRREQARTRIDALLCRTGLDERAHDRVDKLSGGLARRVELVRALIHRPRLLILDEPTVGLDPAARHTFWATVDSMRRRTGVTVVYSTHYMDETELAHHVVVMKDGQCVTQGSPGLLKDRLLTGTVVLHTSDDAGAVSVLRSAGLTADLHDARVVVRVAHPETTVPIVLSTLTRSAGIVPIEVHAVAIHAPSMDDVFLGLTGDGREL